MSSASRRSVAALIAMALSLCFSVRLLAVADCSVQTTDFHTSAANVFNVTASGFTSAEIQTAANYWACAGYAGEIPTFQVGGSGGIPVSVVKHTGRSTAHDGGCGEGTLSISNGQVVSASIDVWTNQDDGVSCAPLTDTIAHEFGHLLGEEEAQDPFGACFGHIMGGTVEGQTRSTFGDDCAVADEMWHTTNEDPPNDPYCEAYGCSPILIDLENDGVHLTGLDDPVWFDIDADGDLDLMSWTDRGEGMLALDRNGNGSIDNGGELFGNATLLTDGSRASNGYIALAELDTPAFGGNGNGVIDPLDAAFSSLRMWTDLNHDGISQPEELRTLNGAGIRRIDLGYRQSRRRDRYGNEFRFLGTAWKEGRNGMVRPVLTWDVFFLVAH